MTCTVPLNYQFGLMDVAGVDEMGNLDDMLEGDDDLEVISIRSIYVN